MAFGTGHHGTTKGCLLALDRLAKTRPARVADIGCGTAVLAMGAAKLWPDLAPVMASDNDPIAVETAAANVAGNGLEGRVICLEALSSRWTMSFVRCAPPTATCAMSRDTSVCCSM